MLVPRLRCRAGELEEQLIARVVQEVQSMYPNITENEDYAGVINERHFARLQNYIDDAVAKGAKLTIVGADKTRASKGQSPYALTYFTKR